MSNYRDARSRYVISILIVILTIFFPHKYLEYLPHVAYLDDLIKIFDEGAVQLIIIVYFYWVSNNLRLERQILVKEIMGNNSWKRQYVLLQTVGLVLVAVVLIWNIYNEVDGFEKSFVGQSARAMGLGIVFGLILLPNKILPANMPNSLKYTGYILMVSILINEALVTISVDISLDYVCRYISIFLLSIMAFFHFDTVFNDVLSEPEEW